MRVKLEKVNKRAIWLKKGKYTLEIEFCPQGWTYTNYLSITKNGRTIGYWMDDDQLQLLLEKMEKEGMDKIWLAFRIGQSLSWTSQKQFVWKIIEDCWEGMLKSAYLSILRKRSTSYFDRDEVAEEVVKAVRECLRRKLIERNKWTNKLLKLGEILAWKKLL